MKFFKIVPLAIALVCGFSCKRSSVAKIKEQDATDDQNAKDNAETTTTPATSLPSPVGRESIDKAEAEIESVARQISENAHAATSIAMVLEGKDRDELFKQFRDRKDALNKRLDTLLPQLSIGEPTISSLTVRDRKIWIPSADIKLLAGRNQLMGNDFLTDRQDGKAARPAIWQTTISSENEFDATIEAQRQETIKRFCKPSNIEGARVTTHVASLPIKQADGHVAAKIFGYSGCHMESTCLVSVYEYALYYGALRVERMDLTGVAPSRCEEGLKKYVPEDLLFLDGTEVLPNETDAQYLARLSKAQPHKHNVK